MGGRGQGLGGGARGGRVGPEAWFPSQRSAGTLGPRDIASPPRSTGPAGLGARPPRRRAGGQGSLWGEARAPALWVAHRGVGAEASEGPGLFHQRTAGGCGVFVVWPGRHPC